MKTHIQKILAEYKWLILTGLGLASILISSYGLSIEYGKTGITYSYLDLLYISLQFFVLNSGDTFPSPNLWLDIGRFSAPIIAATTFILFILDFYLDHIRKFILKNFIKGHIVICGLGYLGSEIAQYYLKEGTKVVIVESDPHNHNINGFKELGATIITGDAGEPSILARMKITNANHVYLVTGNDAVNADIAIKIQDIIMKSAGRTHGKPITLHVHIVDQSLFTVLRNHQYQKDSSSQIIWEFINLYQMGGYCLQKAFPPHHDDKLPIGLNILVIGIGRLGETLIIQIARKWRKLYSENNEQFSCTVIDQNAVEKIALLHLHHPSLSKYCQISPLPYSIPSSMFTQGNYLHDLDERAKFHQIYICLNDSTLGLSAALELHKALGEQKIPIIVRTSYLTGMTNLFKSFQESCSNFSNIYAFPLVSCRCCHELIIHGYRGLLARAIHKKYCKNRIAEGKNPNSDPALAIWSKLDKKFKRSNLEQAGHIFAKIPMIGCSIIPEEDWNDNYFEFFPEEIELLAEEEHKRWCIERWEDGWKFGKILDKNQKISPYLIPYQELEEDIKEYDRETIRSIPSLLTMINLRIIRKEECLGNQSEVFSGFHLICNHED